MGGTVHQRPQGSGRLHFVGVAAKQSGANPEQQTATKSEALDDIGAPRKWLEHGKPRVFKPGQVASADALRNQLRTNELEPRFRRRFTAIVQLFQAFAPPGHADRAERWL